MNQRGVSLAVLFAVASLMLASFTYLSILQADKAFQNQEPERPAFEVMRATTGVQTTQAYLTLAGKYAISNAMIALIQGKTTMCNTLVHGKTVYQELNDTCFSLPQLATQLQQAYTQEFMEYISAYNQRAAEYGISLPENPDNYVATVLHEDHGTNIDTISILTARMPILSPAQDYKPTSINYHGYTIPFPTTNLIPAYLDSSAESEISYKRIGYLSFKPSSHASILVSLNTFINAYTHALQLMKICNQDSECLTTNAPKNWEVRKTNTHAFFSMPVGEIEGTQLMFEFAIQV